MKNTKRAVHGLLPFALCTCLCLLLAGCNGAPAKSQAPQKGAMAASVAVSAVERKDIPVYANGLGTVTAFNTVNVKSRLDGQLVKVAFREGEDVKEGALLAVVDPQPYEVALAQAKANLYKDQATLKDAKLDLGRFQDLYKEGVISKQQLDSQTALVGQLEGAIQADQAQIDNAALNLKYTRITSPVAGRVGLRQVDVGNMVHAADQNPMLVVTQLTPIAVIFTLPEDSLPNVAAHMQKGTLQVEAYSRDGQTKLATGKLLTIDNEIDPTTGTGKLKAIFDNRDHILWPNQFVNIQLLLETRKDSLVVPAAAIQRGPQGMYTYVVKADKTVEVRPVDVGFTQNNVACLNSGLEPGESVVTDGQDKLQAGSRVEVRGGGGSQGQHAANPDGSPRGGHSGDHASGKKLAQVAQ